jgi:ketosteroid isomerase-like protein
MKIRSVALVGLAISFALPIFAQQKDTADSRIVEQRDLLGSPDALEVFGEISQRLDEAYNNKDAAAAAALFTEDGVLEEPDGMAKGRLAIEKLYEDTFQRWPVTDFLSRRERYRLTAIDNAVWSAGEWSGTFQSQTGPISVWGYWSTIYVREGGAWKILMLSVTDHRPPRAASN